MRRMKMKRIIAFALAFITIISLCACTEIKTRPFAEDDETKRSEQKNEGDTTEQQAPKPVTSTDSDPQTLAPPVTEEPKSPIKTGVAYKNAKEEQFSEPYLPTLTLDEKGSFVLVENLGVGMGQYEGSYSMSGNELVLKVEKINFASFAGDSVTEIRFTVNGDGSLTLKTDLCLSFAGDVFRTDRISEQPKTTIKTGEEYRSTKEGYFSEEYAPKVVFDASWGFVLTENLFDGMGTIEGSYSLVGDSLVLKIEKIHYSSFGRDSLKEIRFTLNADGSLTLKTDICLSSSGDIFRAMP